MIYFPTILGCILCLTFKGTQEDALGICQSWQVYRDIYGNIPEDCMKNMPHVLEFLGTSTMNAVKLVISSNMYPPGNLIKKLTFFSWIFAFFLNTVILMRTSSKILVNSLESFKQKMIKEDYGNFPASVDLITSFSFKYGLIPFCCSFILYIIALDWGRWFFITSITYSLCFLTPSLIQLEIAYYNHNQRIFAFLSPIYLIYSKIMSYLYHQSFLQRFPIVYFLGLFYTLFILRIPHVKMGVKDLYSIPLLHRLFN